MISFSIEKRGWGIMSKCPFWSCEGKTVSCYGECPMQELKFKGEECAFKEYLSDYDKFNLKYKDIIQDDYADSTLLNFKYLNISGL